MALEWDGIAVKVVDAVSSSYEKRVHKQIFFAGLVGLALIIFFKVVR